MSIGAESETSVSLRPSFGRFERASRLFFPPLFPAVLVTPNFFLEPEGDEPVSLAIVLLCLVWTCVVVIKIRTTSVLLTPGQIHYQGPLTRSRSVQTGDSVGVVARYREAWNLRYALALTTANEQTLFLHDWMWKSRDLCRIAEHAGIEVSEAVLKGKKFAARAPGACPVWLRNPLLFWTGAAALSVAIFAAIANFR